MPRLKSCLAVYVMPLAQAKRTISNNIGNTSVLRFAEIAIRGRSMAITANEECGH